MSRRFKVGDEFELDGVRYRIVQGKKKSDDLRIDWWQDGRWQAVSLDHVFLIIDMIAENEDVLYPRPRFKGGEYVMDYLKLARTSGWYVARNRLHQERANKAEQGSLL